MKRSSSNKISSPAGVIILVFLLVSFPSILIYFRDITDKKEQLINDAEIKAETANQFIEDEFSSVLKDIYFFSRNPAYGEYITEDQGEYSKMIIEKTSSAFVKIRNSYSGFKLIDTLGNERLFIDFSNDKPLTVQSNSNISATDLFKESIVPLKQNEVSISEFKTVDDQDSDQSIVTVSFTMPVFLRGYSRKVGYIQLTYSADRVFMRLGRLYKEDVAIVSLLNKDRKFVKDPLDSIEIKLYDEAGIENGPEQLFPDLKEQWSRDDAKVFDGDYGLIYCQKINPSLHADMPDQQVISNGSNYYLFIHYSCAHVNSLARKLATDLFLYGLVIMIAVVPIILYLFRLVGKTDIQLKEKTKALEFRNKDLEESRVRMEKNIQRIREYAFENNKTLSELKRKERDLKKAQKIAQLGYYNRDLVLGKSTWSDNLPEIFGLPNDYDFNTQGVKSIMREDEFEELEEAFAKAVQDHTEFKAVFRVIHKDGNKEYLQDIAQPVIENGKVIAMKGTIQNLTERVQIEKELLKAKVKAEDAFRAKSDFLATMSHEIRTPLNAVLGMAGLLDDTGLDEKQQDYVQTIKVSGNSLLGVINDILDFSKIESGQMKLEHLSFNLNQMIEDCLQVVSISAARKNLKLFYKIKPGTPDIIQGDEGRLRQSLINLLNNAVKFTEKGEVKVIISSDKLSDKRVKLKMSIIDTGIGIEEEKQSSIFSAFEQADTSITRKFGGSGLGLAITQKLVTLMGGSLEMKSELDLGSEFTINLETEAEWKEKSCPRVLNSVSIISADTNERKFLSETLECYGVEVEQLNFDSDDFTEVAGDIIIMLCEPDHKEEFVQLGESLKPMNKKIFFVAHLQNDLSVFQANEIISRPIRLSWLEQLIFGQNDLLKPSDKTGIQVNLPKKDLNILVAEDNPVNQKLIVLLFENLGYSIDLAENGVLAVKAAQNKKYDLVFMDIQMPQMGGVEASKYIKEDHGENAPSIIALTANALDGDKSKYLEAGLDDYLSKPINVDELKAMIQKWSVNETPS